MKLLTDHIKFQVITSPVEYVTETIYLEINRGCWSPVLDIVTFMVRDQIWQHIDDEYNETLEN